MLPPEIDRAKRYCRIKYSLAIIDIVYVLVLLFLCLSSGFSKFLAGDISKFISPAYLVTPVYLLIAYSLFYLLDFPFHFYRAFILEHHFNLSQQKIGGWLKDEIKAVILTYIISLILLEAFYCILRYSHRIWWLTASLFWIFFSIVLARLLPVIIIPLFFKYEKFSDADLRQRIFRLAEKMQIKILDVFQINLSEKTTKSNAAFVGWGKTKRVILADTLQGKYSAEEIEVILAHEFAHYRFRHLWKLIFINAMSIALVCYVLFRMSRYFLSIFGLVSLLDTAALPLLIIYLVIFGIILQPLENYISRKLERNADIAALKVTGLKGAFISLMDKLSSQNLVDRNPHPLVKFFFFDHPPVDERIQLAESFN